MGPPKLEPIKKPHHIDESNIGKGSTSEKFPLHKAVREENLYTVKSVLQDNPKLIDQKDGAGTTALHLAVTCKSTEILKFLLEQKADPNVKNKQGKTPYDIANQYDKDDVKTILLQNGAQPGEQHNNDNCSVS
jgi:ankyrin repeat protein